MKSTLNFAEEPGLARILHLSVQLVYITPYEHIFQCNFLHLNHLKHPI